MSRNENAGKIGYWIKREDISMAEIKIGMTIEEASEYTGIGRNTMRKLVEWEKIPVLRIGRKAIIRRDVLERFMAMNEGKDLRNRTEVKTVRT